MAQAVRLRPGTPTDARACGAICYEAFRKVCTTHGFPPDFPSVGAATDAMGMMLGHPRVHSVIAEIDGRIVGSNYLEERSSIRGVGPISVDPTVQNRGVGRQLMQAVLDRAHERRAAGVRLLQAGFHNRSLGLYTELGFRTREPISILQGAPVARRYSGCEVRPATPADLAAGNTLCLQVHGFDRGAELAEAITQRAASVVERGGRITAYTTSVAFFGHTVAETNTDLMALIGAAPVFGGPGFLLPTRNHEVFTWCLAAGLKLVYQMNLMSVGLYNEATGAWLPSVLY
jgi:predicted N-acetyltransferase YhbS